MIPSGILDARAWSTRVVLRPGMDPGLRPSLVGLEVDAAEGEAIATGRRLPHRRR